MKSSPLVKVTIRSAKKVEKILVVENVDTTSTAPNESSPPSLSKKIERSSTIVPVTRTCISGSQSLKSITDKPSENLSHLQHSNRYEHCLTHSSKPHTIIPIQDYLNTHSSSTCIRQTKQTDSFKSNTTSQLFDSIVPRLFQNQKMQRSIVVHCTITSNAFTSSWIGITTIYYCDSCTQQFVYAPLSYNYVAIDNVTRITFALRRDLGYFGIDDVSIRDAAAPGTELLSNGGFETGNFSSWTHCVQSGSLSTGSVQANSSGISYGGYTFTAHSGSYYYLGGATVYTEYLSQAFPSVIGNTYIFSFVYVYVGSGSLSSRDFYLVFNE